MIIPVLMYHEIVHDQIKCNKYQVSQRNFSAQMRYLKRQGYKTITVEDFNNELISDDKQVIITFDDGFESDFSIAVPILRQYGFKSIHFIITNYVGTQGYMNWAQIKELKDKGCSIESHTKSHNLLERLNKEEIKQELLLSKQIIEQKIGVSPRALSLPRGGRPKGIEKLLKECDYKYLFTSKPVVNYFTSDNKISELGRVLMTDAISFKNFQKLLTGDKIFYWEKQTGFILKQSLKRIFGNKIYHKYWKILIKKEK